MVGNASATSSVGGLERSSTIRAGVAVGCARISALMATDFMAAAICEAGEAEEYAAFSKRRVREQRGKWSATLPYQSHWPKQERSNERTGETQVERWSSRAACDSQVAHCSSLDVWVACNGAARPGKPESASEHS